jgi:hypothetical protein
MLYLKNQEFQPSIIDMASRCSLNVLGFEGAFFAGEVPGTICFVPASMLLGGQLDRAAYVAQEWASLNIHAQRPELRLGSHLFPDLKQPMSAAASISVKNQLEKSRLQTVHTV